MIAPESGVFMTSYRADLKLYRLPFARYAMIAFLISMYTLVPIVASNYQVYVLDTILIASIGAIGLNLLTGVAGQISVGHGGFLGVGAFTSALLASRADLPIWMSVPIAGLVTACLGVVIGLPSLRIKGLYLAIATLAAQVIIDWVLNRPAIGGGGSVSAPRPALLHDDRALYFVLVGAAVLAVAIAENLLRSRLGRALLAVRDHDIAATVIGIDVGRYKLLAFGVSSFYAGIAGALLGHLGRGVNYEQFQLGLSVQYLAMIVIGGLGSIPGSIFGATFVTLLPILLRDTVGLLPGNSTLLSSGLQLFLFGLVIVAFMVVEPHGLVRMWRHLKDYVRLWPFSY